MGPQFGVTLSPWGAGMIAIGLQYASYLSEVFRGGLDSVPKGQWEAASSLNLSTRHTYCESSFHRPCLPPWLAWAITLSGFLKTRPCCP
nr:hypothetical protein [Mesorhizobium sp.]